LGFCRGSRGVPAGVGWLSLLHSVGYRTFFDVEADFWFWRLRWGRALKGAVPEFAYCGLHFCLMVFIDLHWPPLHFERKSVF
jgi:hypothetical protein